MDPAATFTPMFRLALSVTLASIAWLPLRAMPHGGTPPDTRAFATEAPGGPTPGAVLPNFRLTDHRGLTHELYYESTVKAVVLVFTGTGSPRAVQTASALRALRARFAASEVAIWQIDSNIGASRPARRAEA